ncbi:hypothetical protein GJAV_G00184840 [Gymnothorax javanicus]|nr:hypothetical protein GJAV_G00184840 [Gymnothorax javanicus]
MGKNTFSRFNCSFSSLRTSDKGHRRHSCLGGAMATGGGDDPLTPDHNEHDGDSLPPVTEENVVQDTDEVFRSYVFYRFAQDVQEGEVELPTDPEIMALQPNKNSPMCRVGQQLAIIGDDINRRYDLSFMQMLSQLAPTPENAYEYFCKIAKSLFDTGINWGRVIALLSFGYRMALHVFQHGMTGFLSRIARFIGDFLLRNRIAQWIARQGGWVAALELDNPYVKYLLALLAVLLLGQFVDKVRLQCIIAAAMWVPMLGLTALPHVGGVVGALITRKEVKTWYPTLNKPSWTPPNGAFPVVWTCLYTSMGYGSYLVWKELGGFREEGALVPLGLYGLQLALNWAWTPTFFGAHKLKAALIDNVLLMGTVGATMVSWYPISRTATLLMTPYLLWLCLATSLSYCIWRDNPEPKRD